MKILVDNGHGNNTPGKCSPDKTILEYKYVREIASAIVSRLKTQGYDAELLTPELGDISISQRVARANNWCSRMGFKNVLLVSVHLNAAGGDGKWHNATGWSGWVAPNASDRSKEFAQMLYAEAEKRGMKGNRSVPACKYWVGNFGIIRSSNCPAVLTENMFQDSQADVTFLKTTEGREKVIAVHVDAIKKYVAKYGK